MKLMPTSNEVKQPDNRMHDTTGPNATSEPLSIRAPELVAHLFELNLLLARHESEAYWQKCAEVIQHHTDVDAVNILLFSDSESIKEVDVQVGELDHSRLLRLDRWREALQLMPMAELRAIEPGKFDEFHPIEVGKIDLGVGRRKEDMPILHMRLYTDDMLRGGISLVFSRNWLPEQIDYAALAHFVHLVIDSGLDDRQLRITRHRLDQVNLIAQVSQSLNGTLDLEAVLQETTELTADVLQAQAATLFLTDERHNQLIFYVPTGKAGGVLREMRIPMNQGVAGWVAINRESIIVSDVATDQRFSSQVDAETGFQTKNILCVPLLSQGRLIGVLELLNKETAGGFTQEDLHWLETMASQAAVALENAHLFQNLRNEQERIIRAEENVRRQLNRDLHDGPAQLINLIIMNVGIARQLLDHNRFETVRTELDLLENLGRHANREIRSLLFELRPVILESQGLIPALRSYIHQLTEAIDSQAQVTGQPSKPSQLYLAADDLPFSLIPQADRNIFSVIQEAINNIRKYANAENVWVRVVIDDDRLIFAVEDDGIGFDVAEVLSDYESRGSFGLLNMYERTEMLEGTLTIKSPRPDTDTGTLVQGSLPLSVVQRIN